MTPRSLEALSSAPDGRSLDEQPRWRKDFPVDWSQDDYVSRRDLVKFLVLTSGAFVAGQGWIGLMSLLFRPAVTFVGHATFLIQTPAGNLLTDPMFSRRAGPFGVLGPRRVRRPAVRFDDLPPIGTVLLSHNHYDHCDLSITSAEDVAFCHTLVRVVGTRIEGFKVALSWRTTICFRKIRGRWLIEHVHASLPFVKNS